MEESEGEGERATHILFSLLIGERRYMMESHYLSSGLELRLGDLMEAFFLHLKRKTQQHEQHKNRICFHLE